MKIGFWRCSGLITSLCAVHAQDSTASCRLQAEHLRQQCIATRRGSVDECKTQQRAYYQMMLSRYNQEIKAARDAVQACTVPASQEFGEQYAEAHPELADNIESLDDIPEKIKELGTQYVIAKCGGQVSQFKDIEEQKPQSTEAECERDYYGACNAEFNYALSRCGRN